MKLDKRIVLLTDIITCFNEDRNRAERCVGQMGYFSDDMMGFGNLNGCVYGKLENYSIDEDYPFKCTPADIYYSFFIPESVLKPKEKEKKYRPFKDTREFFIKTNFEEGDLIHIRFKNKIEYWLMLVGWTNNRIKLGTDDFTFENLFENFELWDGEENFIPFGVLEQ